MLGLAGPAVLLQMMLECLVAGGALPVGASAPVEVPARCSPSSCACCWALGGAEGLGSSGASSGASGGASGDTCTAANGEVGACCSLGPGCGLLALPAVLGPSSRASVCCSGGGAGGGAR
jgi:hypothetical protein